MKRSTLAIILASGFWFSGCYQKEDIYISDLDLVVTNYDATVDFKSKKTYAISDSIIVLFSSDFEGGSGDLPDFVNKSVSAPIIANVDAHMASYGYSKVTKSDNPDVTLLLSVMESTSVYYVYDYYYWGWYYPYYWYYPYSMVPYTTTSSSGTMLMMMLSNKDVNAADRVPVIWVGVINGLLEGGNPASRITSSIDQTFKQSPYLKH